MESHSGKFQLSIANDSWAIARKSSGGGKASAHSVGEGYTFMSSSIKKPALNCLAPASVPKVWTSSNCQKYYFYLKIEIFLTPDPKIGKENKSSAK